MRKNRHGEAVLSRTHNLCFLSRNKKNNVYPCKPQFYYINVGFKGVNIIKVCFVIGNIFTTFTNFYVFALIH